MTDEDSAPHAGAKRRLFFSFGAQTFSIMVRIAVQLLMVPIFLHGWGTALYQDWLLIFSATGFLSILDLGMQAYFANALLAAWARQDLGAYRRHLGTALGLYAIVLSAAAAALILSALLAPWSRWLGTATMSPEDVTLTLCLLSAASLILIPTGLLSAIYRARGDYGLGTSSSAIAEACRSLAMAAIILSGRGPLAASIVYFAIAILFVVTVMADQRRRYRGARLRPELPSGKEIREALSHSTRYLLADMATPMLQNAPILILGRLGTAPGAVVAFSVFRTLTGLARQIVAQMSHGIGGELGHRHFRDDFAGTGALIGHAGRLVSGIAGLLCGAVLILSRPFIAEWTQNQIAYDPWLCALFLMPVLMTAPAQIAYVAFQYTNRPTMLVVSASLQMLGTVLLCALLAGPWGADGAAFGCAIAEMLAVGLLLPLVAARGLPIRVGHYFRDCLAVAAVCFALSTLTAGALMALLPSRHLLDLMLIGGLWCALLAWPTFRLLLSEPQRRWILEKTGRFLALRRRR